jgi:molybdopterin-guanine dinucleotide biosynthesis protein A
VVDSKECADAYAKLVPPDIQFVVDENKNSSSLSRALTGFQAAKGEYTLLLPAGSPFVSHELLSLLFELSPGKAAVVPRWTNQECEPLHAVYCTEKAIKTSQIVLAEGYTDVESMVEKLQGVRYLSTLVIEQIDPEFKSFFTVTTPADLRKATLFDKQKAPTKKKIKQLKFR